MLVNLIKEMQSDPRIHPKYQWQDDILTRKGKLVIRSSMQLFDIILEWMHSSPQGGHSGVKATEKRIKSLFYWKGLLLTERYQGLCSSV